MLRRLVLQFRVEALYAFQTEEEMEVGTGFNSLGWAVGLVSAIRSRL